MHASNWRLRGCITFTDAQLHSLGPNEPWGVAASNLDFDNRAEYAVAGRPPAFLLSQLLILLLLLCRRVNTGRQLGSLGLAGLGARPQAQQQAAAAAGVKQRWKSSSLPAVSGQLPQPPLYCRLWTPQTLFWELKRPQGKRRTDHTQRTSAGAS